MVKIKVKNFGPIKEGFKDEWIDLKKATLFIGDQGTGKSTLAKLISTFKWIEKAITRGDYPKSYFEQMDAFRSRLEYHKISHYLPEYADLFGQTKEIEPEIAYQGEAVDIVYTPRHLKITEKAKDNYLLPQIIYIPAERNFLSAISDPKAIRLVSEPLIEMLSELENAKKNINDTLRLPINGMLLKYSSTRDELFLVGDGYQDNLYRASSGFQSVVPLYLVTWYLANIVKGNFNSAREPMSTDESKRFKDAVSEILRNPDLSEELRRKAISALSFQFTKTAFINIVEEPEQNLFPTSQWSIMGSLLEYYNLSKGNELIITTHSPYILSYLTLAVKAWSVYQKIEDAGKEELLEEIENVVPYNSALNSEDLVIYEIDNKGEVIKLDNYKGLPSDENYLNEMLENSNILFSQLLDIEDKYR
ncbi:AAA family ATPase [[Flexibacter] sp. ATCC 35208]|uniref:AAA family ATPase n=1 Tax=[Flexibacter] sp. ATCC 35208 TaxID=1936242 RepID=UPI0009C57E16|nr:AAA family ATPase [[Flexibacter] sp. ATCC 35208]OMP76491.1 hypothetical protein BW716_24550 [[Flexibacter] sp. ATCC 35208]